MSYTSSRIAFGIQLGIPTLMGITLRECSGNWKGPPPYIPMGHGTVLLNNETGFISMVQMNSMDIHYLESCKFWFFRLNFPFFRFSGNYDFIDKSNLCDNSDFSDNSNISDNWSEIREMGIIGESELSEFAWFCICMSPGGIRMWGWVTSLC